ncbi:mesotocin receptor-like [Parasteatoda tepidariorum]|uniref:mesotocin receptor-like n=1 Tax=Parasteatoda tepidariorum TaxID=114398 RepID=UPI001C71BCB6|nr:mesotocin receptor-like [Parasteatoda tepidariorum]XP_042902920.1 mesotocin receptor-like [Parasteatoda tepidariorum]XP_042902921.1 mesotocin receptor-like [Parasteatoda tepidariorum]
MATEVVMNNSEELWRNVHSFNSDTLESQSLEVASKVGLEYDVDTRKSLLSAMILFSLLGNFLVFWSFYPYRKRGIPKAKVMFLYLAIADCFVAFFTLGAQLLWEQDKKKYFVDNISCKCMKFMQTYSLSLSGYMLVTIALDRYNAIINALTRTGDVKWWIIFPWVISVIPASPCPFLFHTPDGTCVSIFYSEKHNIEAETLQFWRRVYITLVVIIVFGIPTILLLFGYIGIYYKLSKQSEVFTGIEQTSTSLPRAKKKTFTLAMVVTSVFLFTSIPYIVQEFYLAYKDPATIDANAYLIAWSGVISAFNSVLNPYIYLLFQYTDCCIGRSIRSVASIIRSRNFALHMPVSSYRKNMSVVSVSSKTSKVDMNTDSMSKTIETALICNSVQKDYETCV